LASPPQSPPRYNTSTRGKFLLRTAIALCWFLAGVLAAVACYKYVIDSATSERQPPPGAGLVIEEPDRDLGVLPLGMASVTFRIRNISSQPIQILGSDGG
jgi:hypothetical protein